MDILVTLNENYLPQLKVMLTSLWLNNPGTGTDIWLLHSAISDKSVSSLSDFCARHGSALHEVKADQSLFANAPSTRQYPPEMYYRLLAGQLLPKVLKRVIYIDPDTLIINSLLPLWETDLQGRIFGACAHTRTTELANDLSRIRLGTKKYYNSGVLLIDLEKAREKIVPDELFIYADKHRKELILPDQDMLNAIFGNEILDLPDIIWNYDARNYSAYRLHSNGEANCDWVMEHTAILHFCGKEKPWKNFYRRKFGTLYKHYMNLCRREI